MADTAPPLRFDLVNAFAVTPHVGSQAAVIVIPKGDPRAKDETYLLDVSRDFEFPATVFISPIDDEAEEPRYTIRWFTANGELPLCGHGTVAASNVVFTQLNPSAKVAHFEHPKRGDLVGKLEKHGSKNEVIAAISLPITPAAVTAEDRAELEPVVLKATGLKADQIVAIATYKYGSKSAIIHVVPSVDLQNLKVNTKVLAEALAVTIISHLPREGKDGIIPVESRVFIPVIGLDEDVITGSAHSVLTGYYLGGDGREYAAASLKDGSDPVNATLDARQLSKRGGGMRCQLVDGRARLVGHAWRVGSGTLEVFD